MWCHFRGMRTSSITLRFSIYIWATWKQFCQYDSTTKKLTTKHSQSGLCPVLGFALLQECRSRWAPLESQKQSHHLEPEKEAGEMDPPLSHAHSSSPSADSRQGLSWVPLHSVSKMECYLLSAAMDPRAVWRTRLLCPALTVSQRSLQPLPHDTQGPFSVFTLMVPCRTGCSPPRPLAPLTLLPGPLLCQSVQGRSPRSCPRGRLFLHTNPQGDVSTLRLPHLP